MIGMFLYDIKDILIFLFFRIYVLIRKKKSSFFIELLDARLYVECKILDHLVNIL